MNDHDLDHLIARANPFGDDRIGHLPLGTADSDLLEQIMTTTSTTPNPRTSDAPDLDAPTALPERRRRRILIAAAAVVIACVAGVGGALFPRGNPAAPPSAYAAAAVEVAKANPRLLLDQPGWKVDYVGQFTKEAGEMHLSDGKQTINVHWRPTSDYAGWTGPEYGPSQSIDLLGQHGSMTKMNGGYMLVMPPQGVNFLQIEASTPSQQAFRDLMAKLYAVDVDTWLAAMPASVVKPDQTSAVVDEMLADIPVPAGFDREPLNHLAISSRYDVGAEVTQAVACSWLASWDKAKASGDTSGVRTAVDAMQGNRSWNVWTEMDKVGAFHQSIQFIADRMKAGGFTQGERQELGC